MLPPKTERLWEFLKDQTALAGFVLIGGTALALRINHRRSEDLDFAYLEPRLPRVRLEALCRVAAQSGLPFRPEDDEVTVQEFAEAGLDPRDYQQNFIVNDAVKVSFFAPDTPLSKVLSATAQAKPRLATLPELFKSKVLVSAIRSKTRDWFDLYLMLRDHGFSIHDFQQTFREAGIESQCATALTRLCGGIPQKDDEGYAHLVENPPSLVEMTQFFNAQRNLLEIQTAQESFDQRQRRNPGNSAK